jgi:hypothetical protein
MALRRPTGTDAGDDLTIELDKSCIFVLCSKMSLDGGARDEADERPRDLE